MTITRFAPSPTGYLHVGNARVALLNYLYSLQQGGQFILRLDDTDQERSTAEFEQGIRDDLEWLGLKWDSQERQTDRFDRYNDAAESLKAAGRLYPCYETPEELNLKRKVLAAQGKPPIYDRAALELTDAQKADLEAQGITPHWRFKLNHDPISWQDMLRGEAKFHGANISDPVLLRANGLPIYSLSSVVDDIDMAITHVIRGEDHITNTAIQVQVCEALGGKPPVYCHMPLLSGKDGQGLSKREGSLSLRQLREQGILPMAINSLLVKLGAPGAIEPVRDFADLSNGFDLSSYSRSAPKFDDDELQHLNSKLLHILDYNDIKPQLDAEGLGHITEPFWQNVRANLDALSEIGDWWQICHGEIEADMPAEDWQYCQEAISHLPDKPWDETTFSTWTTALKTATNRKGKALFMPLRLALTGQNHGPEMANLLPLLDYDLVIARLGAKKDLAA